MDLFLIRHAHAVDGDGMRDDDRPLSAQGRRQALDVGGALSRQKVRFGRIVTSPLVRAVETAELVAVSLGFDGGLDVHEAMRPDGSWKHL
jgi:phosphohistidine phosphatase